MNSIIKITFGASFTRYVKNHATNAAITPQSSTRAEPKAFNLGPTILIIASATKGRYKPPMIENWLIELTRIDLQESPSGAKHKNKAVKMLAAPMK